MNLIATGGVGAIFFIVALILFGACDAEIQNGTVMETPQWVQTMGCQTITVDRETPIEEQIAQLAAEGKISTKWWKELTSANYPTNKNRSTHVALTEAYFLGQHVDSTVAVVSALKEQGVRHAGDPYELVAWVRGSADAGRSYPIVALDQLWMPPMHGGRSYVPFIDKVGNTRAMNGGWGDSDWDAHWRFLVACE